MNKKYYFVDIQSKESKGSLIKTFKHENCYSKFVSVIDFKNDGQKLFFHNIEPVDKLFEEIVIITKALYTARKQCNLNDIDPCDIPSLVQKQENYIITLEFNFIERKSRSITVSNDDIEISIDLNDSEDIFNERFDYVVSVLQNDAVSLEAKQSTIETFANQYPYYDTSKFNKYFKEAEKVKEIFTDDFMISVQYDIVDNGEDVLEDIQANIKNKKNIMQLFDDYFLDRNVDDLDILGFIDDEYMYDKLDDYLTCISNSAYYRENKKALKLVTEMKEQFGKITLDDINNKELPSVITIEECIDLYFGDDDGDCDCGLEVFLDVYDKLIKSYPYRVNLDYDSGCFLLFANSNDRDKFNKLIEEKHYDYEIFESKVPEDYKPSENTVIVITDKLK